VHLLKQYWFSLPACLIGAFDLGPAANVSLAQGMPDHPSITVEGKTYTPLSIVTRNMGTKEEQEEQFPPHKIIGNVYYVGTKTLSSFLIVTPEGNILMDTTYERNVDTIKKSVEQLGFKFSDVKYVLGNHAHDDHMEGDFKAKELTGAKVIVMAEDVPALQAMRPGGKEHPIDRVIHDGDTVTLGGVTLTAHLTAGHTHGATTWTMKEKEGGKTYDVVFFSSLR
jgi:metallo-beta-lactamase class B